jgi:periplasmic protein TonB
MLELKTLLEKTDLPLLEASPSLRSTQHPEQRRMMVIALTLLLVALGIVLYRDRDFWFAPTPEAEDQPEDVNVASKPTVHATAASAKKHQHAKLRAPEPTPESDPTSPTIERTILPPLEVEVVAGNVHRMVHPGNNSVKINMLADSPQPDVPPASTAVGDSTPISSVTSEAAERVRMSADTSEVVTHSVNPDYPVLAREMKVQGSVILQALISRDGAIQDLHVLSGPPILASAAEEAVRQWHFRPHYQDGETVETKAKITVNFTISTN